MCDLSTSVCVCLDVNFESKGDGETGEDRGERESLEAQETDGGGGL